MINSYGTLGIASNNPKDIAIKYLQKVILNHKNSLLFMEKNNLYDIANRFSNSLHILQELDLMLNHEEPNEAVTNTSNLLKWLMESFESTIELAEEENLTTEKLYSVVENELGILDALLTGFKGMRDE